MNIFANIVVALIVVTLLGLAIRSIVKQGSCNSCSSCKKCSASNDGNHSCPPAGCGDCPFSGTCHK
ncbi:MAG: hypothetical protein WCR02_02930 [Sphaerochaetaceae bacterium]